MTIELTVTVLSLSAIALAWAISVEVGRLRTWSHYWRIASKVRNLPFRWRRTARLESGDLVLRGKHKGKAVTIRFSRSDFSPELRLIMEAPVNLHLSAMPRRNIGTQAPGSAFPIGEPWLDATYVFNWKNAEEAKTLRAGNFIPALRALCKTGNVTLFVNNRGIDLSVPVAPKNLGAGILVCFEDMLRFAERIADVPGLSKAGLIHKISPKLGWKARVGVAAAACIAIVVIAGFPPQRQESAPPGSVALADGSAIDYRDGAAIPLLRNWRLATRSDFTYEIPQSSAGPMFPLRLRPSNAPEETESVYVLQGADESKRICILVNGKLVYDARYDKLAGVLRIPSEDLATLNWDSSDFIPPPGADGLLILTKLADRERAYVLVVNHGHVESLAPTSYPELRKTAR